MCIYSGWCILPSHPSMPLPTRCSSRSARRRTYGSCPHGSHRRRYENDVRLEPFRRFRRWHVRDPGRRTSVVSSVSSRWASVRYSTRLRPTRKPSCLNMQFKRLNRRYEGGAGRARVRHGPTLSSVHDSPRVWGGWPPSLLVHACRATYTSSCV